MNTTHTTAISYVRFSSRKQAPGVSVVRQIESTREFCKRHSLILDESRSILDPGLSGFRGANTDTGNLGTFIKGVQSKKIESNVVLVVEALDRITRQEITEAIHLLTELLILGVQIGIVSDNKILTHDSIKNNPVELIIAVTYLIRGHDESRMKSNRTGDAVKRMIEKVKLNQPCKLGGYLPPWITFDNVSNKFRVDKDRAQIVKDIFNSYLANKGTTQIVKELMRNKTPKYNNIKSKWRAGGIRSMLLNTQVIGTLKISGLEFPRYLPSIINENDFNRVQLMIDKNTTRHGKHDGRCNNLFSGVISCESCGESLAVHKSGATNYFYCLGARDYHCKCREFIRAEVIERYVFGVLLLRVPSILLKENDTTTSKEIAKLETELESVRNKRKKTLELLDDDNTSTADLKPILSSYKTKEKELLDRLIQTKVKKSDEITAPKNISTFLQLINTDLKDDKTRHQIKALIPSILNRIVVNVRSAAVSIQLRNDQWLGNDHLTDEQADKIES